MSNPIRVLVVDDSAFMRKIVSDLLQSDPDIQVVGTARDGLDALEKVTVLQPDVVTLDVEMPRLDGLGALGRIMAESPRPVVMVSSLTQRGAEATIQALSLGAIDFVPKPSGSISLDLHKVKDELVRKVKTASRVLVRRHYPPRSPGAADLRKAALPPAGPTTAAGAMAPPSMTPLQPRTRPAFPPAVPTKAPASDRLSRLVVIASSTGGPGALHRLLDPIPAGLRAGLIVVQHMPAGFTHSLAVHLDQSSGLSIREAKGGDRPTDGSALVAPGGYHLVLNANGNVELSDAPPRHGVRPAADVTLESIPPSLCTGLVVIILTGMGMDGARGAKYLKERGAVVWAQDEASSVVYGMPRAVKEIGVVDRTGNPEQLASWLMEV